MAARYFAARSAGTEVIPVSAFADDDDTTGSSAADCVFVIFAILLFINVFTNDDRCACIC